MPFYTQGPEQFTGVQQTGIDNLQSTFGEGLSAAFSEGFNDAPTSRIGSALDRLDDSGRGQQISAEDANQQYGIPGTLSFDKPVSDAVASDLNSDKRAQMLRQQAMDSAPGGVIGSLARFGAGSLPQFLDPGNLALSFVPGLGDARLATMLGEDVAGGAVGRLVQGASQGVAGQAAFEPLNYVLDRDEHTDWSMGQALGNIAFGGVLGGGLHIAIPHERLDELSEVTPEALGNATADTPQAQRLEVAGPDLRDAALKDAVTAQIDDRAPVGESLLQINEAQNLRDEMQGWVSQGQRVSTDENTLLDQAAQADERSRSRSAKAEATRSVLTDSMTGLREQHAAIVQEEQALRDQLSRTFGDTTPDRLEAVHSELDRPGIPRARREQLEAERQMLEEGGGSPEYRTLERARTEAQIRGITKQRSRLEKQIARQETKTAGSVADPVDQMDQPGFRAQAIRINSRRDVVHAMAARSLSRYARRIGSAAGFDDLVRMAASILGADDPAAAISEAISEIRNRPGTGETFPDRVAQAYQDALSAVADMENGAARQISETAAGTESAAASADRAGVDRINADAPAVPTDTDLSEIEADTARIDAALQNVEGIEKEMSAIADDLKDADGMAKAYEAATACLIGGK